MITTPADPGEIDLVKRWKEAARRDDILDVMVPSDIRLLIKEIGALRERVVGLEGEVEQAIKWQQFYMNKAEAAEARVAELAEALRRIENENWDDVDPDDGLHEKSARKLARAALAATPAKALERAKAVEKLIIVARDIASCRAARSAGFVAVDGRLDKALTNLDALGKE